MTGQAPKTTSRNGQTPRVARVVLVFSNVQAENSELRVPDRNLTSLRVGPDQIIIIISQMKSQAPITAQGHVDSDRAGMEMELLQVYSFNHLYLILCMTEEFCYNEKI